MAEALVGDTVKDNAQPLCEEDLRARSDGSDEENMRNVRHLLIERMDPDFGLLDKLLQLHALTFSQSGRIKCEKSIFDRNEKLLDLIFKERRQQALLTALTDTGQKHLSNLVKGKGVYKPEYDAAWPLQERETQILDDNRCNLVVIMDTCDLINRMFSKGVINLRQHTRINSLLDNTDKSEALLDILRRGSEENYWKTVLCLRESNQSHVAEILKDGGVLARVDVSNEGEIEQVNVEEDQILEAMANLLHNTTLPQYQRIRKLLDLRIMRARKGQSIVFYIYCKTLEELLYLHAFLTKGEFKKRIATVFDMLISKKQTTVSEVSWSEGEFTKFKSYFERLGVICEVEERCDENDRSSTSETTIHDLPLELLDMILGKVYGLSGVFGGRISLGQPTDEEIIRNMASVDYCWFQRVIGRRRFKNEIWRHLKEFYKKGYKRRIICRNTRLYLVENIQTKSLLNKLRSVDCLTDIQTRLVKRVKDKSRRLRGKKEDLLHLARSLEYSRYAAFVRRLRESKQTICARVATSGGVVVKAEIHCPKFTNRKLVEQQIVKPLSDLRDTTISKTAEIKRELNHLKADDIEVLNSLLDRNPVVWLWCHSDSGRAKLQADSDLVLKLLNLEHITRPSEIARTVNIDGDRFRKEVVYSSADEMELRDLIEAHKDLITDRLDPDFGLLDELLANRSLTRPEVAKIKAVPDSYGRSEKLMEYIFNKGIHEKFLDALRKTQQTHLAKFILSTGEVVRVRSELETESDVNEVEDELITKFTEMLGDCSLEDSTRILKCTQLRLIAAKKGNSVIPYRSKTLTEPVDLQEIQTSGKLANDVGEMFNSVGAKGKSCDKDDGSSASNTTEVSDQKKAQDTTQKPEEQHLEITECPICLNVFTDPRMLPCIHTFCFECLKRTSEAAQKKPGDKMPCPLCRKEFIIPADGMNGVQKNFFVENLLDFKLAMHMGNFCTKHIHKPLDYYCPECKKTVCVLCFFESHKLHDCKDVTKVDKDFRKTIEIKALKISTYTNEMLFMKSINDKNKADFLEEIDDTEKEIHEKNQELKDMIDRHTRSLLDELSLIKSKHLKEVENQVEEIERYRTVVGSFEVYCKELTLKGSASDICSSVDQLLARADELEREEKAFIGRLHQSVQVSFQATDLGYVLPNTYINFVGAIEETNAQYENFALFVGIDDGKTVTRDVVKINLNQPNEITTEEQLPTAMAREAFAAVYKNTIYVTGIGINIYKIWKYKKSIGWKYCASLVEGRRRHSAAFIDEVMYICGGFVDSTKLVLDSVEAFNAVTNTCAVVGKLVHCVMSSGNCVPFKNSLYIFGGGDKDNTALNHVQVYNTKDNTCSVLSKPMPWPNMLMPAALWETSVILLGYNICLIFNIETETWQERKQFKTDVHHFGLVLANERVFVIGGGYYEEDKAGKGVSKCRDDVRYVPLQNIIDDTPIEWKIHGKLPKPCFVQAYANIRQLHPQAT